MRTLQFGKLTHVGARRWGELALHIQCPWRIESDGKILTGFHDWYSFVGDITANQAEPEDWDPARGGSLQELRLRELFECPADGPNRTLINNTDRLMVTHINTDAVGGCRVVLDDRLYLVIFPCSTSGEYWRLLRPGDDSPHLIVEAPNIPTPQAGSG